MNSKTMIHSPDDPLLGELCERLAEMAVELDKTSAWPGKQLRLCGEYGVFRWFLPEAWGGFDWSEVDVLRGYLKLSQACLTTTFIITQRTGACKRILRAESESLKAHLLPDLAAGETFATVGISHLTTSRRHLAKPVLTFKAQDAGFLLDGYSPWVTGGPHADTIVVGASDETGQQILVALPTTSKGVSIAAPEALVGLSGSHTGEVRLCRVFIPSECLIDGPRENVMAGGAGGNTGGLQTSTLAAGLSAAAIEFLTSEANRREDLLPPLGALQAECQRLKADLVELALGEEICTAEELRSRANSLALRSTQAALAAAKGTGYVVGHPAGRWCREALFFLVWSCPYPVVQASLCELAGLGERRPHD
jgi:alkylation response protein AidB-like acyl-CoA dehydrogenase